MNPLGSASVLLRAQSPECVEPDLKRRPEFALNLFSSFSERLRQFEETIEGLVEREVSTRLATLLSHLGNRFG